MSMSAEDDFSNKYRPQTLDRMLGNEQVVTRLKGIVASGRIPKAILLTGRSSAGKTTGARCFVADLFKVPTLANHTDYHESNAADARGIDDLREVLKVARLKPRSGIRRVFMVDEAHGLTGPSAELLLKPLENPPPHTLFILGSSEPEKLKVALKNRCSQFVMESPTKESLLKYVKRIMKGEQMSYMTAEMLDKIVNNCNGEFRTAANLMESVFQFVAGKGDNKVTVEDITSAIESTENADEQIAVKVLLAVYANKLRIAQKAILDVQDAFKMIGALLRLNSFLLNNEVLKGEQHKAVWWSQQNRELLDGFKVHGLIKPSDRIQAFNRVQQIILDMRMRSAAFLVPEQTLISTNMYQATEALKDLYTAKSESTK